MKKLTLKIISSVLVFAMSAIFMANLVPYNTLETEAANITQADIQKLKDKIAANDEKIKQTNDKINKLSGDITNYLKTVEELQNKISNLESNISDTKTLIAKYEVLISETEDKIFEKENQINAKYDDFLDIIRKNFEEGSKSYLEILFDSEGLSDFLSRADRLGAIITYEQTVLSSLEKEIEGLRDLTVTLENAKNDTVELGKYQSSAEDELQKSLTEAQTQLNRLQKDQAALKKVQQQAAADDKTLDKQLSEMLKKYQEQQAAEANAKLLWPVDAKYRRISSPYGWRWLWGEKDFHLGIDIVGARRGEIAGANVYASAAGTVVTAKYHNSYGYYVLIDHGNTISTLYAHCSKLLVKAGQKVSRGQVIGYVGLTGNTSGYHLHYEVRKNGSTTDPLAKNGNSKESWLVILNNGSYVDPIKNGLLTID